MNYELIAAVDLGSNSFRLQVGRIVGNQIYPLDFLKESVRLAAGLTAQRKIDSASQLRALETLGRFGERLRGFLWRLAQQGAEPGVLEVDRAKSGRLDPGF